MEGFPTQDAEQIASEASGTSPSGISPSAAGLIAQGLWTPPSVHVNSEFENTVNGWLPFQVPGFNFFISTPRGLAQWDTGTGKTVLACGVTRYMQEHWADLIIWIVKVGTIENSRRALEELVGIDGRVPLGSKVPRKDGTTKRDEQYGKIAVAVANGECPVVVTNYEKLKTDKDYFLALVTNHKVFVVMDEPSEKLRHRDSGTYRAVAEVFYSSKTHFGNPDPKSGHERPSELRMLMLDATPIRDNPEGFFNVVRILAPNIYGSQNHFNKTYVAARNPFGKPITFKNLSKMGDRVAPITMQIDKDDPEIAKQFPKVQFERVYCDLRDDQEKLYKRLTRELKTLHGGVDPSFLKHVDILSTINVFQMLVNNPIMVAFSAHEFEDFRREAVRHIAEGKMSDSELGKWMAKHKKGSETAWKLWNAVGKNDMLFTDMDEKARCTIYKMLELHRRIDQHDGKIVVFSWYANLGIPRMSYWLERWDIPHVTYTGSMTRRERQHAEDDFRNDPDLKVFLASDAAGSSLNLEMADMVIHYDLPDLWAALKQRQERVNRVTSKFEHVKYLSMIVPGTVEDRKLKLLDKRYGWHKQVLKGTVAENAAYLRDQSELLYVLTGLNSPV